MVDKVLTNGSDSPQSQQQPQQQQGEQNQQQQQPQPRPAAPPQQQQQGEQNQPQPLPQPQPRPAAPPQQWVAMQYPGAAMVMPPQMMPPQHYGPPPPPPPQPYIPYHQYHPVSQHVQSNTNVNQQQQGSNGENKTIWVGDLHHWMDENYLHSCFGSTGEITSLKVIRNKQTGLSEGYGFVEFYSHATAEKVLQSYAAIMMPNTEQSFRLNWATFSTGDKRSDNGADISIFVGDLAADVNDSVLLETFSSKYPSVKAAKVVCDANTGRSKGYGFVRFGDDTERAKAMTEMNGIYCSSRPMRIGAATPRKSTGYQQQFASPGGGNGSLAQSDGDSSNTTIFVGGLGPNVTDEDLRQPFAEFGEIVSVKIPVGKGCGFVQFANRNHAEEALQKLNNTVIGKQTVRLSWGRNPANKQFRSDFGNQWMGAYYGGGQIYDGYGYGLPPHDPRMYAAAAYAPYPMYGGHQQQVS